MRRPLAVAAFCVAAMLAAACGGISDPSKNTVEDFVDTITPFEVNVYEFDVRKKNGEYSATIIAISPTQSALLNIALGGVANGICTPYADAIGVVGINRLGLRGPIAEGHYCIQVFDQGILTTPQTYTLRVSHP